MRRFLIIVIFLSVFSSLMSEAQKSFKIYINADMSVAKSSGAAIEMGLRVALSEVNYNISGYNIEVVIKDHHGNSRRSLIYLEEFVNDDNALVTLSGLHSPPIINNLDYINNNGIPILDPWAAAGPITRSTDSNGLNWVFRLSVDDTKAGEVITSYSLDIEKYKNPVLLLEDTGWGKSNYKNMSQAIQLRGLDKPAVVWFSWGIKENGSREILNDILHKGHDVVFFVGNSPEGIVFFKAMSERDKNSRIPIRSHWGITGGDFFEILGSEIITNKIDLKFIQTSFSFLNDNQMDFSSDVFKRVKEQYSQIKEPRDLKAPNGFIHTYDITRLFIEAFKNINFTDDIKVNRGLLRESLENIQNPVEGLVKTYIKPYSVYSSNNSSAHEALNIRDFSMAKYLPDGSIEVFDGK